MKQLLIATLFMTVNTFCADAFPLHTAIRQYANIPKIRQLIAAGANVNQPDEEGITPLETALICANYNIIEYLYVAGANIHQTDKYGNNPLHLSLRSDGIKSITAVLACNPRINQINNRGETPLCCAILHTPSANSDQIELLLTVGARLDKKSLALLLAKKRSTLLPLACAHNHANFQLLQQLTTEDQFDAKELQKIKREVEKIQKDRVTLLHQQYNAHDSVDLIQRKKRGILPRPPIQLAITCPL